jgi:hypothetical protein
VWGKETKKGQNEDRRMTELGGEAKSLSSTLIDDPGSMNRVWYPGYRCAFGNCRMLTTLFS